MLISPKVVVLVLFMMVTLLPPASVLASGLTRETGLASSLTGWSIYTGSGYQNARVEVSGVRVRHTNIALPSSEYHSDSSFWLTGLNYTRVFDTRFSFGAQIEYYPINGQMAVSVSPGYALNDSMLSYLKLGWANVPTTVDQGPGRQSLETNLNAFFVGAGVKMMVYQGVFGYAELTYSQLERLNFTGFVDSVPIQGSADITAVNAMIGLGYRF